MAQGLQCPGLGPIRFRARCLGDDHDLAGVLASGGQATSPDADTGKIGPSGKRPRFRLTTHQTRLAGYLPAIETALEAAGLTPAWLIQRDRAAPFSGRSPIKLMAERDGEGS
jgi:hypothetical protein